MANFCAKCGAAIAAGARFCPECGAPAAEPTGSTTTGPPPGSAPGPAAGAAGLTTNLASLLCYVAIFITGIVFLVLEPYRREAVIRFHAWQAIFFGVGVVALSIVNMILTAILLAIHLWIFISLLHFVIGVGLLVIWIVLMVKAYNGEKFKLPVLGDLAEQQAGKM